MKKIAYCVLLSFATVACESDFEEAYTDPSKISLQQASLEKLFTGLLVSTKDYVLPEYGYYFITLRTTLFIYTQATGYINSNAQYKTGAAAISGLWDNYYKGLLQFRELEKTYNNMSEDDKKEKKIFLICAKIYLYNHTQRMVDLFGDIPFSNAGLISVNGGNNTKSLPSYDSAQEIYKVLINDLKSFSEELNTITITTAIQNSLKTQDFINNGNIDTWKRYCNSLRLRLLNRVSGVASFNADSEIKAMLSDPAKYPLVENNTQSIQIDVFDISTDINSKGFQDGLAPKGNWFSNLAGKHMVDYMNTHTDPRRKVFFDKAKDKDDKYIGDFVGLDPLLSSGDQRGLVSGSNPRISIYSNSTFSSNQKFPGILITASEVAFLKAEYYLRSGDNASAKTVLSNGIKMSSDFYYDIRSNTNNTISGEITKPSQADIVSYVSKITGLWDRATSQEAKLEVLMYQKWIHFNVIQLQESWAEYRRTGFPRLKFQEDISNANKLPPNRFVYPSDEQTYNAKNYNVVKSNDTFSTKIFWDLN